MDAVRGFFAIAGACLGFGLWEAVAGSLPEAPADRWTLGQSAVPVQVARLAGSLPRSPSALDLWSYRVASPRIDPFRDGTVELDVRVPEHGQLFVRFGADAVAGPSQPTLPPPGASGGRPALPPLSAGSERGAGVLVDRGGNRIVGRSLTCDPAPAPTSDRFRLAVDARGDTMTVSVDGAVATRCRGSWNPGALVLGSGVRRVQVYSATVGSFHEDFGWGWWPGAVAAIVGAVAGSFVRSRAWVLAAAPLLALPLLGRIDLRATLDALRLLAVPEAAGGLVLAGVPAMVLAMLTAGATAPTLRAAALRGALGVVPLGAAGIPLAALAWINTHPFARRVSVSYALCAAIVALAELGVRLTPLGESWAPTAGFQRASTEFAELLEIRKYRSYPIEGFPVEPPPPNPAANRIVALGGSSTGGAFQMDDLEQFWPRRLAEELPGWEVVNQGVGGWNTLHIRLYVESQAERLDADVFALYVGHNDVIEAAPVPYKQLYARYRAPSGVVTRVASALSSSRLYMGLKFALFALRDRGGSVAVPVEDARENLSAVIDVAQARGARVLLMNEGLNPDPEPMREYGAMLRELAAARGALYVDAAEKFRATGDPELFLDDCHLSVEGHRQLARWAGEAIGSGR